MDSRRPGLHSLARWVRPLLLGAFASAFASSARAALWDFEQPAFIERGYRVKDHALLHDGTVFHLFYIRGELGQGLDPSLGHAESEDLRHWTLRPPVLAVPDGRWATRSIWAPQVLPAASLPPAWRPAGARWAMLATGVNTSLSQSIGLAWSADLEQWAPAADPVYTCGPWSNWSADAWADCRDPFAFVHADTLFLLAAARMADGHGALALAAAPLDATGPPVFADLGPVIVAPDEGTLESPQLVRRADGDWCLLYTRGGVGGTSVMRAPDFRGPWDLSAGVRFDEGAAPEITPLPAALADWAAPSTNTRLFSRHENYLEWGVYNFAIQFDLLDLDPALWPPALHDRQGLPGWTAEDLPGGPNPFLLAPTFEDNPMARGATTSSGYGGHSWISSFEAYRSVTGGVASHVGDSLGAAAVGIARSPVFTVMSPRLDFLLGGAGHPDSCALSLRRASDGALLFRTPPPGGPGTGVPGGEGLPLAPHAWDLRTLRGVAVQLELEDRAQGPGGFIALDEIRWSDENPDNADPPLLPGDRPGFVLLAETDNPWLPSGGPLRLSLRIDRPGAYAAAIYDVRGRRVAHLGGGDYPAGERTLIWAGGDLPAGLYLARIAGPGGALTRKVVLLR
ncbi:MAG: hypothetical protein R3C71_15660 [Candidatus Krumholzibacteriia bacterium]